MTADSCKLRHVLPRCLPFYHLAYGLPAFARNHITYVKSRVRRTFFYCLNEASLSTPHFYQDSCFFPTSTIHPVPNSHFRDCIAARKDRKNFRHREKVFFLLMFGIEHAPTPAQIDQIYNTLCFFCCLAFYARLNDLTASPHNRRRFLLSGLYALFPHDLSLTDPVDLCQDF